MTLEDISDQIKTWLQFYYTHYSHLGFTYAYQINFVTDKLVMKCGESEVIVDINFVNRHIMDLAKEAMQQSTMAEQSRLTEEKKDHGVH